MSIFPKKKWMNRYEATLRLDIRKGKAEQVENILSHVPLSNCSWLRTVICKLEFCHPQQGRCVSNNNKPNLPQRWWEALRSSWQPNEEKGGCQQQEVPEAWGMHAEVCRQEGRPAALLLGGASTRGGRRKKCHQQMFRQKDLGHRSLQVLGSSWRLNCLRRFGQWIRSGRGASAKLLQWRV